MPRLHTHQGGREQPDDGLEEKAPKAYYCHSYRPHQVMLPTVSARK